MVVLGALAALCWASVLASGGEARPAADPIDSITLERGCFGCAGGTRLQLRRDGSALLTRTGNARMGTVDQVSTGRIAAPDFDRLARRLLAGGFFELADQYADPQLQDGPWATLTVTRGAQEKQVFRRDEAGPPALKAMEAAVDAARAAVQFSPAPPEPATTPR